MKVRAARFCIAGVIVGAVAAGCYRQVYVYEYADGRRVETNYPLNDSPQIEISDLKAADAAGQQFTGEWRGEHFQNLTRGRMLMLSTVSDAGRRQRHMHITSQEIVGDVGGRTFDIRREPGTLKFERTGDAGGRVTLSLDPAYLRAIAEATGQPTTPEQNLSLFESGLSLAYVRAIKDAGYTLSLDELFALRQGGVSAEFVSAVKKAGYDFKPPQLINLSRNGISREYAVSLREAGFKLSDEQLIKLSRNGIGREYAREIRAAGYPDIDDIIELSRNGVSRSFAQQMGQGGKRPAKALVELSRNGVSPSFGDAFAKIGYTFSDDDLIKLGRNGVSASFAKSILEAGYQFSADDLVELSRNGVSSDYAKKIKKAGYTCSAADLVALSRNGVSSSFMVALHDENKPNLSVDAIVDLSRKGVDAETVKRIRGM
ncbi:MAG: hypothetical protein QOF78_3740 [Phycisphaerales bacterium]|jgi:hypothetical protein|nr:hypothetical protein [Phycisphaerales bacterium]